jgi:hypothetical protein
MNTVRKNDTLLKELGFVADDDRLGIRVLNHPTIAKVRLVSYDDGRNPHVDMFTEFGSSPLNVPGDPLNICIRVQNHNDAFAESVIRTVVESFLSLV